MEIQTNLSDFQDKSLNNVLEICYVLDSWITTLHMKQPLRVEISETAKNALLNALISLRRDIRNRNLPDLSNEAEKSYAIDIFEDMIVIGVQTFIDPIKLAQNMHNNTTSKEDDEPDFKPMFKYMLPAVSVNKWAEINNVAPNTVRQWINRHRIPSVKKDGSVLIPLLATTPDNIIHNPSLTMIWNNIGYLPAAITNRYSYLREKSIMMMMLIPRDDGNFNLHVTTVDRSGEGTTTNAFDVTMNAQERKNFVNLMSEKGYNSLTERRYHPPLPSSEWTHPTRLPVISAKTVDKKSIETYPPVGFIGKGDLSAMNPTWEISMVHCETKEIVSSVRGSVLHNATSAGDALLTAIMSEGQFIQATRKIKEDSGWPIDNGWASDTLYATKVTGLESEDKTDCDEEITEFLRTIAYRINNTTRQKFFRVIIDMPEDMTERAYGILTRAGYRCIPHTTTFYAYILW